MWQPCGIWGDFRPRCPVCWTNLRGMPDIFGVISDATRRDILQVLLERHKQDAEISVSEIVAQLELSQPTVSKHLKVLRDAGLVSVREDGQHRFYSLESEPLGTVDDWLVPFLIDETDTAILADPFAGDLGSAALPEGAQHAAEVFGRTAAQAKRVVATAMKRLGV